MRVKLSVLSILFNPTILALATYIEFTWILWTMDSVSTLSVERDIVKSQCLILMQTISRIREMTIEMDQTSNGTKTAQLEQFH